MKDSKKVVEHEMEVKPCVQCGKPIANFYGRWGNSGTCSKKCEVVQEAEANHHIGRVEELLVAKRRGDTVTSKM